MREQFSIRKNKDAKRYEFNSIDNNSYSYTVAFSEVDNLTDAKIAVWKAVNPLEPPKEN